MKNELTFTDKEKLVIEAIKNYDTRDGQRSDNYSNFCIGDANDVGIAKKSIPGVIGSLEKKGIITIDERKGDLAVCNPKTGRTKKEFHIVYFNEVDIDAIYDAMGWDMENSPSAKAAVEAKGEAFDVKNIVLPAPPKEPWYVYQIEGVDAAFGSVRKAFTALQMDEKDMPAHRKEINETGRVIYRGLLITKLAML